MESSALANPISNFFGRTLICLLAKKKIGNTVQVIPAAEGSANLQFLILQEL